MIFVKPEPARPSFTLIHVSDFHLCHPAGGPFSGGLNKRVLSYLSWKVRRRKAHRGEILRALARAVQAQGFDQMAVTGDLTQLALPAEFENARRQLQALGPPEKVFVVPGNHDALVPRAWEQSSARWADYLAADSVAPGSAPCFPTLRVRGPVALIGLCTARPTRPFSAAGSIGPAQLGRCAEVLAATARRGLYRVLLIHHPPVPNAVSRHKRLTDAETFLPLLRRYGAELILHGHSHRRSRADLPGPSGPVPVLGISSASASALDSPHRSAFRVFRIAPAGGGWSTAFRDHAYDPARDRFIPEPEIALQ
jgi:3',5'-cyclic AMP phosphodiesterase CpdA